MSPSAWSERFIDVDWEAGRSPATAGLPGGKDFKKLKSHKPRVREPGEPGTAYGALDLGTNNCRLLIARPNGSGFHVVDAFSRIVRLGEGLNASGKIDVHAMDRTIGALRICANKLVWHSVVQQRLIATEACRTATNGAAFIDRVEAETGLKLEVINRETEARLAAKGAAPLIDRDASSTVVFDIGGGSTEVLWLTREGAGFTITAWTSLPAGVVTLSEKFGGGLVVTDETFAKMRVHIADLLRPFVQTIAGKMGGDLRPSHLLGTSGTVTTIAGVHLGLRRYDRNRVDGCWMTAGAVDAVTRQLLGMSYDQRAANGCIGRERADLVLAGCAILEEVRSAFPADNLRVADRGLREGLLAEMFDEDGA